MTPRPWHHLFPLLFALAWAGLQSCQTTTVIEEEPPSGPGEHFVHFRVPDSSSVPDSVWYKSILDSGATTKLNRRTATSGFDVVFIPTLHPLERDSLAIHSFRLGLHTGVSYAKQVDFRELGATKWIRSGADSLALNLLHLADSARRATPKAFPDSSNSGMRAALDRLAAELIFQGHPSTLAYRRTSPSGLDTAALSRQILTLASQSEQTLAEVVRSWNLPLDYLGARQRLAAMRLDSQRLNPFRLAVPLRLDTLHLEEPAVGLTGRIFARTGIQSLDFAITNDSGDRTDRFVLSDLPDTRTQPISLNLGGHPTIAPRPHTSIGRYVLMLSVADSLGNRDWFADTFQVAAEKDHQEPDLEITSPRDTSLVAEFLDSLLNIQIRAQDASGIRSVSVDGKPAVSQSVGHWSAQIVIPRIATSTAILIVAADIFGNEGKKQILVRREAPKPPTVKLVEPTQNSWLPFDTTKVLVSWQIDPGSGSLDSAWIDNARATCDAKNLCHRLVSVSNLGSLSTLPVKAWNSVGLTQTDNVTFGRRSDSTGPVIWMIHPPPSTQAAFDVAAVEVAVSTSDPSGVDSVLIAGNRASWSGEAWKQTIPLGPPGELTRIQVRTWDRQGNRSDSVFLVSRAPVPSSLPPSVTWLNPPLRTGTILPFDSTGLWVRVRLFDLSGIDTQSVTIGGKSALTLPDSVWSARIDLPPNGTPKVIALELKNRRGVRLSDLATVARRQDTVRSIAISDTVGRLRSGGFWVRLVCPTPGSTIHYTLDGAEPTELSPKFKDSLKIDTSLTLKARGFATDRFASETATQKYQLALPVEVIGGSVSTLFRLSDGSLWGTGQNDRSQFSPLTPPPEVLGNSSSSRGFFFRPVKIADSVIQAHTYAGFSHWVKADHTLWGIGMNSKGQLGDGTFQDRSTPVLIARDIAKVTSMNSTLVLKVDSTLWITGPYAVDRLTNQMIQVSSHVRDMISGYKRSWILRNDGSLWSLRHDLPLTTESQPPLEFVSDSVKTLPPYESALASDGILFLKQDGTVWGYGANTCGILGTGDRLPVTTPIHLTSFDGLGIQQISLGETHALFTSQSGAVYATGTNLGLVFDADEHLRPGLVKSQVSKASAGLASSFFLNRPGN